MVTCVFSREPSGSSVWEADQRPTRLTARLKEDWNRATAAMSEMAGWGRWCKGRFNGTS